MLGRSPGPRRKTRLPQLPSHSPRSHRHHRLHDGLRHNRRRAGSRAGEVQKAGWRRHDQDRQQHRADGVVQARLLARRGRHDRQLHRRDRHHRRRAACQGRPSRRLRLLVQAGQGHALDPLHGTPEDDGGDAAVYLRSYLEDRESSRERLGRRHHGSLSPGVEAGA